MTDITYKSGRKALRKLFINVVIDTNNLKCTKSALHCDKFEGQRMWGFFPPVIFIIIIIIILIT